MTNKIKFCWLCGNKLWGNSSKLLTVDGHERTFHKKCAKDIEREWDFKKIGNGYQSMIWTTGED